MDSLEFDCFTQHVDWQHVFGILIEKEKLFSISFKTLLDYFNKLINCINYYSGSNVHGPIINNTFMLAVDFIVYQLALLEQFFNNR
ncbi:MAG: hypothetical protein KDC90_09170 [Ignavibacteriae bacterium]|nr:hypothetical protein [Ignavibacteriota bacterium]